MIFSQLQMEFNALFTFDYVVPQPCSAHPLMIPVYRLRNDGCPIMSYETFTHDALKYAQMLLVKIVPT